MTKERQGEESELWKERTRKSNDKNRAFAPLWTLDAGEPRARNPQGVKRRGHGTEPRDRKEQVD